MIPKNIWLLGKIKKNISLRVISGILPKLEYHFFEIYMFQIIKIIHMIPKNIRFQGKIPKNISLRVISGILPKLEWIVLESKCAKSFLRVN